MTPQELDRFIQRVRTRYSITSSDWARIVNKETGIANYIEGEMHGLAWVLKEAGDAIECPCGGCVCGREESTTV